MPNGDTNDSEHGPKPTIDEEMAALAALVANINDKTDATAGLLVDTLRETSTLTARTSLEGTKKVADMLLAIINAQGLQIAELKRRTVRLERTAVALIARGRSGRRK
jgi:hypothetical protein